MGSILDLVGDRVHGWDRSSRWVTMFGVTRIGLGVTISLSWLLVDVLNKGGGELRRGTPACEVNFWKQWKQWHNQTKKKKKRGYEQQMLYAFFSW